MACTLGLLCHGRLVRSQSYRYPSYAIVAPLFLNPSLVGRNAV